MILHVSPGSPGWVQAGAAALLIVHIGAGGLGLASGAAALTFRKGGRAHGVAGTVFFFSMLAMAGIGAAVSPFLPQRSNVVPGLFTGYLVATGWMTARSRTNGVGMFELAGLFFALGATAIGLGFGLQAMTSPTGLLDGESPGNYFFFATLPAVAAALDASMILRGGVAGPQRLVRHIWRMCAALLIAALSLFLGQPKVFPPFLRGSPVMFAPEAGVLGLMIFWLVRVRFANAFGRGRTPTGARSLPQVYPS